MYREVCQRQEKGALLRDSRESSKCGKKESNHFLEVKRPLPHRPQLSLPGEIWRVKEPRCRKVFTLEHSTSLPSFLLDFVPVSQGSGSASVVQRQHGDAVSRCLMTPSPLIPSHTQKILFAPPPSKNSTDMEQIRERDFWCHHMRVM